MEHLHIHAQQWIAIKNELGDENLKNSIETFALNTICSWIFFFTVAIHLLVWRLVTYHIYERNPFNQKFPHYRFKDKRKIFVRFGKRGTQNQVKLFPCH